MPMHFSANFAHNEVHYTLTTDTAAELVASVATIRGENAQPAKESAPASTPAPAPTETAKGKKSASTEKAAASSPPADSTKEASAASAPTPASPSPAPAAAEVTYEKSGLGEKIAAYLGKQDSAGYADRRAKLVELLKKYEVTTGKNLKLAQFEGFAVDLAALAEPADDLG